MLGLFWTFVTTLESQWAILKLVLPILCLRSIKVFDQHLKNEIPYDHSLTIMCVIWQVVVLWNSEKAIIFRIWIYLVSQSFCSWRSWSEALQGRWKNSLLKLSVSHALDGVYGPSPLCLSSEQLQVWHIYTWVKFVLKPVMKPGSNRLYDMMSTQCETLWDPTLYTIPKNGLNHDMGMSWSGTPVSGRMMN